MKYFLLTLAALCFGFTVHAQNNYEAGYYIDAAGQKIEGLIKNEDWKNTPSTIKYKKNDQDAPVVVDLASLTMFEIYEHFKYSKHSIQVDITSDKVDKIDVDQEPNYVQKTVLLKHLIEGEATLYNYSEGHINQFYYSFTADSIKPLVHKKYLSADRAAVLENNYFRSQLLHDFNCEITGKDVVKNTAYYSKSLIKFFKAYNECSQGTFVSFEKKKKKFDFHLNAKLGVTYNSVSLEKSSTTGYYQDNLDFDAKLGIRPGIEAEVILPFNNNKWSITAEPSYTSFSNDVTNPEEITRGNQPVSAEITYKAINIEAGIRYAMFLNNTSKLYTGLGIATHIDMGSNAVTYHFESEENLVYDTKSATNIYFGAGYKFADTYIIEFRFYTQSDLTSQYIQQVSKLNSFSLTLGYTLF